MKRPFILFVAIISLGLGLPVVGQQSYGIPICRSPVTGKSVGFALVMDVPSGTYVKKGFDVDYGYYNVRFGPKSSAAWLTGMYGPYATSGHAPERLMSTSTNVIDRTWTAEPRASGVDSKGTTSDGKHWRYFGMYGEGVWYEGVSAEVADHFDKMIDTVCFIDRFK